MIEKDHGAEFFEKMVTQIFPLSYPCAKAAAFALNVGSAWKNLNVLDIAAGSGAWGIAFAQIDVGTKVTALDFPHVLQTNFRTLSFCVSYVPFPTIFSISTIPKSRHEVFGQAISLNFDFGPRIPILIT